MNISNNTLALPSRLLGSNLVPATGTVVVTEEVLHSIFIPTRRVILGDILHIYSSLVTNSTADDKTFRIYFSADGNVAGAAKIATANYTANAMSTHISRFVPIISDVLADSYGSVTASTASEYSFIAASASANITVPSVSAGFYVLITGQKETSTDTDTVRWTTISQYKP